MSGAAPRIQRERVRRTFDRVAADFAAHDFLYREMSRRMDERLDMVRLVPERILDAGCGLGADRLSLNARYPAAAWLGIDQSVSMLCNGQSADSAARGFMQRLFQVGRRAQISRLAASMDALPLAGLSVIWSGRMPPCTGWAICLRPLRNLTASCASAACSCSAASDRIR